MGMKMKVKRKVKTKKKTMKKRVLLTAKCGLLPILSMLCALESLIGRAVGVAKAVNDKATRHQLEELRILLRINMERDYISTRTNVDRV